MRLTANILKAMHLAHKETCPRCLGGSPCPEQINLYIQFKSALLTERPQYPRMVLDRSAGRFRRQI